VGGNQSRGRGARISGGLETGAGTKTRIGLGADMVEKKKLNVEKNWT
jgi:hypothetical protein